VDRVLQPALVAMDPRCDGLPGGIGNSIAVQSPEGWSFVSAQDSGSKKISAMALNSTRPERGSSLILYRGAVVMPRCSSKARSLPVRIGDSAPKDSISSAFSVHFLVFGIARGMVLFVGLVFCVMVLRLLLLLSRRVLSRSALRNHQLYLERFLF
jgi:hypothetical protein